MATAKARDSATRTVVSSTPVRNGGAPYATASPKSWNRTGNAADSSHGTQKPNREVVDDLVMVHSEAGPGLSPRVEPRGDVGEGDGFPWYFGRMAGQTRSRTSRPAGGSGEALVVVFPRQW